MSVREEALELAKRAAARGQHGHVISPTDLTALARDLGAPLPAWLSELFTSVPLSGLELGWRESPGPDGIAWLQWSDARNIRSESFECYPGCAILPRGYVNVASCLEGSGDPYFICFAQGEDPPLYRVYHDVSDQPDLILADGLHEVAPSLTSFFRKARVAAEGAAYQALEAGGARRLGNESFFSAPQLKRGPLGAMRRNQWATRFSGSH